MKWNPLYHNRSLVQFCRLPAKTNCGRSNALRLLSLADRLWPTAENDFKPGKLLAREFAEFAAGSFSALQWRAVRGHYVDLSIMAVMQSSQL